MLHPVQHFSLGLQSEHEVYAYLLGRGLLVGQMMPYSPYDLVAHYAGEPVQRIQVKRAYYASSGKLEINCKKGRGGETPRYYGENDFDVLAIVIPSEQILFIPWHGQYKGRVIITDEMRVTWNNIERWLWQE
jgi:hypothetical protein